MLIPKWGIMGAASATLVSDVVLALVAYRLGQSSTPIPYQRGRWFAALACVAAGLVGLWAIDARLDALWPRVLMKILWAAAAAGLTLRAAQVNPGALRQFWSRKDVP
jgi:O-antigen/teichoic acid export membrane protein